MQVLIMGTAVIAYPESPSGPLVPDLLSVLGLHVDVGHQHPIFLGGGLDLNSHPHAYTVRTLTL